MKTQTLMAVVIVLTTISRAHAQSEFEVHPNGLIYGDSTIEQLRHIIDSLNIKYKVCERRTDYLSLPQGFAHYVFLDKPDMKNARKDMENNISIEAFIRKYPAATLEKNYLVGGFEDKNKQVTEFIHFEIGDESRKSVTAKKPKNARAPFWVYEYRSKTSYGKERLEAFYFPSGMQSQVLRNQYAALVQYVDCMVDTSTAVMLPTARRETFKQPAKLAAFNEFLSAAVGEQPTYNENDEIYSQKYDRWLSQKDSIISNHLSLTPAFKKLLLDALQDVKTNGGSDDEFEEYVKTYQSPAEALYLKRNRKVFGQCSMDTRPRLHALNIAQLSAQTIHWETFLRAHLDLLNDNFERMSDGSYAWARRQTYLKELEILDLNLADLLLGITLRIHNPSANHYYGDIPRTGRALAETSKPDEMESRMLSAIGDAQLDMVNRVLVYYLYSSYNAHLPVGDRRRENIKKLQQALSRFPSEMAEKIIVSEQRFFDNAEKEMKKSVSR